MPIWGAALRGFGKALKKARGKGKVYKTIKSVKPLSGKIPWYVGAGKTAEGRAKTVKTWKRVGTDEAITKAQKGITEGKKRILQQIFMIFSKPGSEGGVFIFIGKKIN